MYAALGEREQQGKAQRESGVARGKHVAPFETVRGVAGKGEEQDCGQELSQANEAKIERTFSDLVDLPTDGDRLHLDGGNNQEPGGLEKNESGMGEGGASGSGIGGCGHLSLLL